MGDGDGVQQKPDLYRQLKKLTGPVSVNIKRAATLSDASKGGFVNSNRVRFRKGAGVAFEKTRHGHGGFRHAWDGARIDTESRHALFYAAAFRQIDNCIDALMGRCCIVACIFDAERARSRRNGPAPPQY